MAETLSVHTSGSMRRMASQRSVNSIAAATSADPTALPAHGGPYRHANMGGVPAAWIVTRFNTELTQNIVSATRNQTECSFRKRFKQTNMLNVAITTVSCFELAHFTAAPRIARPAFGRNADVHSAALRS